MIKYFLITIFLLSILTIIFYSTFYDFMEKKYFFEDRNSLRNFCKECIGQKIEIKNKLTDKYLIKKELKNIIKNISFIETHAILKNSNEMKNFTLPEKYVIKSTYGSGRNILSTDKLNKKDIMKKIRMWEITHYERSDKILYEKNNEKIMIENFIDIDYEIKSIVVMGKIYYAYAFDNKRPLKYYNDKGEKLKDITNLKKINEILNFYKPGYSKIKENFDIISKNINIIYEKFNFDFFRLDAIFSKDKKLYLGEITFAPEECTGLKLPHYKYNNIFK